MQGVIKMVGVCIIFSLLLVGVFDIQKHSISKIELFNKVRTTQLSIMEDSINIGDLIVENSVTLNEEYAKGKWFSYFNESRNIESSLMLNRILTNESLPAIAVKVNSVDNYQILKDLKQHDFSSVIIAEGINE